MKDDKITLLISDKINAEEDMAIWDRRKNEALIKYADAVKRRNKAIEAIKKIQK